MSQSWGSSQEIKTKEDITSPFEEIKQADMNMNTTVRPLRATLFESARSEARRKHTTTVALRLHAGTQATRPYLAEKNIKTILSSPMDITQLLCDPLPTEEALKRSPRVFFFHRSSGTSRSQREVFSIHQLRILHAAFQSNCYPSYLHRQQLSRQLNTTPKR
ncbi:hypothetical protein PROFUN_09594 [Planoprotostelium fungivorum]|uniref:Homeobox domain-containing protein n=1 Tax=Planoprotostelium fungivorum TaxID=1890364 RepID=A0A2P6NGS9_9EUKA|nr:hypothetical protein PROFUN_09594 [Planoprotostelium fungivorum]